MKSDYIRRAILALLKSEGIEITEKDRALKSLSECVSAKKCISEYLSMIGA